MPSSGPGRQPSMRQNSLKKKKKNSGIVNSGVASLTIMNNDEHRQSIIPGIDNIIIDGSPVENDFSAMQQIGIVK